jgi:Ring finger domain
MSIDDFDSSLQQIGDDDSPTTATAVVDPENYYATDECRQIVQLPKIGINTDRAIAGVCTICLCPYEGGDQVTWSTEKECQHAFHTDCIIPWLAKKEEPKCPVCRQEFCATPNVSHVDDTAFAIDLERENSFLHTFSQALAMSQLYRPYASESSNDLEQARSVLTLQLATLALENHVRLEQQAPSTAAAVNTSVIPNGDSNIRIVLASNSRHNSSRVVGDGNDTDLATASSSSENAQSTTGHDTTNENSNSSDIAPAP